MDGYNHHHRSYGHTHIYTTNIRQPLHLCINIYYTSIYYYQFLFSFSVYKKETNIYKKFPPHFYRQTQYNVWTSFSVYK